MQLIGNDLDIFVLGRKINKKLPQQNLEFILDHKNQDFNILIKNLLNSGIQEVLDNKTKFGRIGIIVDRQNFEILKFLENLNINSYKYSPKSISRAEKLAKITTFNIPVIKHLANEGFGNSVEFRRLIRKYIRLIKHANIDSLIFADLIFGEEKTKKVIQKIAGTQLKIYTLDDFYKISKIDDLEDNVIKKTITNNKSEKLIQIKVENDEDLNFIKKRATEILRCKISQDFVS